MFQVRRVKATPAPKQFIDEQATKQANLKVSHQSHHSRWWQEETSIIDLVIPNHFSVIFSFTCWVLGQENILRSKFRNKSLIL